MENKKPVSMIFPLFFGLFCCLFITIVIPAAVMSWIEINSERKAEEIAQSLKEKPRTHWVETLQNDSSQPWRVVSLLGDGYVSSDWIHRESREKGVFQEEDLPTFVWVFEDTNRKSFRYLGRYRLIEESPHQP